MISIDRASSVAVHAQISDQVRYLIATGRFRAGAQLPSTRALARQLDVSYHTVRSAYRTLEEEGRIEARGGSGFRVLEGSPVAREERMEEGAAVFQETLRRLLGLGLAMEDIEYLFQEQLEQVSGENEERKLLFAAPAMELAQLQAEQIAEALHQSVEATTFDLLPQHSDADFVFASFEHVRRVMIQAPRADVRGVVVHLNPDALERIVRLLDEDTLGVIARRDDAIPPLIASIREEAGFRGQMLAFSTEADSRLLGQLIDQATLVVYTPPARRALLRFLRKGLEHVPVRPMVSTRSIASLRLVVPS